MAIWNWNGAEFEAKALTVRDELRIDVLGGRLQDAVSAKDVQARYECLTFAEFVVTTTLKSGDPGLPMATPGDTNEALVAAMDAWLGASGWVQLWRNAVTRANATPNGADLQPGTEKND